MTRFFRLSSVLTLTLLLSACSLAKFMVEHAPYTVLISEGAFELRHYPQLTLVSTRMELDTQQKNEDSAFLRLFDFISGDNASRENISMTAPVLMDEQKNDVMSFVLPQGIARTLAPTPDNDQVYLDEIRDTRYAVVRFNGTLNDKTVSEKKAALIEWMSVKGYEQKEGVLVAAFDPPSSLPIFRRNEVMIPAD